MFGCKLKTLCEVAIDLPRSIDYLPPRESEPSVAFRSGKKSRFVLFGKKQHVCMSLALT